MTASDTGSARPVENDAPEELISKDGFRLFLVEDGGLLLRAEGVLRDRSPRHWLGRALDTAIDRARRANHRIVTLDARGLEYTNATGFRVLIAWLGKLQDESPPIVLRIALDPAHLWQKVALHTLRVTGAETVEAAADAPLGSTR